MISVTATPLRLSGITSIIQSRSASYALTQSYNTDISYHTQQPSLCRKLHSMQPINSSPKYHGLNFCCTALPLFASYQIRNLWHLVPHRCGRGTIDTISGTSTPNNSLHTSCPHNKIVPNNLKGKSKTSQDWLTRQLNDPYVQRARKFNYRYVMHWNALFTPSGSGKVWWENYFWREYRMNDTRLGPYMYSLQKSFLH